MFLTFKKYFYTVRIVLIFSNIFLKRPTWNHSVHWDLNSHLHKPEAGELPTERSTSYNLFSTFRIQNYSILIILHCLTIEHNFVDQKSKLSENILTTDSLPNNSILFFTITVIDLIRQWIDISERVLLLNIVFFKLFKFIVFFKLFKFISRDNYLPDQFFCHYWCEGCWINFPSFVQNMKLRKTKSKIWNKNDSKPKYYFHCFKIKLDLNHS